MKYLLLLLLVTNLYSELVTTGNLETSLIHKSTFNTSVIDANINNDIYFERTKIGTSVGMFVNDSKSYNNNVKSYINRIEIYRINELYITQYITDDLSVSLGIFPFKKGTFYEYGYNGNRTGIGIYTLSDANLQGGIITYKINENNTIQFGSVAYEKYFRSYTDKKESDGPITFRSYQNSGMDFIDYKNTYGKWYSEFMITDTYQYVNEAKIMSTNTFTTAISYDNEVVDGRTYYGILTFSNTDGDTGSLSPYGRFSNEEYHFDKFKSNGYSLLLGYKQELDKFLFDKDWVYGVEYLKRSEGYHSLLAGEPLSYDSYSNIGDSYNTYIGIRYNKNILAKLRYYYYDAKDRMTKGILSTETTNLQKKDGNGNYDAIIFQLYIDF